MGGDANNHIVDKIIHGAKSVKKTVMNTLFTYEKVPKKDPSGELEIWSDHTNKVQNMTDHTSEGSYHTSEG